MAKIHRGAHSSTGHADAPSTSPSDHAADLDNTDLLLIVVGAAIESEIAERPLAGELRDAVERRQREAPLIEQPVGDEVPLRPVVCTDVWFLNDSSLGGQPVICIGPPQHNAATAYFAGKLPTAFILEGAFRIQLDPQWLDLTACIWGVRTGDTAAGVRLFCERYLDDFVRAALER